MRDDMTVAPGSVYTGHTEGYYEVQISDIGATDKFHWRKCSVGEECGPYSASIPIAVNRARLHRDVTVECCRVLGKDAVSKHIGRCFQLACDLLKALEDANSSANSAVQILVWFCQHDAQKQHTSLDARLAVASTKAREEKVANNLGTIPPSSGEDSQGFLHVPPLTSSPSTFTCLFNSLMLV